MAVSAFPKHLKLEGQRVFNQSEILCESNQKDSRVFATLLGQRNTYPWVNQSWQTPGSWILSVLLHLGLIGILFHASKESIEGKKQFVALELAPSGLVVSSLSQPQSVRGERNLVRPPLPLPASQAHQKLSPWTPAAESKQAPREALEPRTSTDGSQVTESQAQGDIDVTQIFSRGASSDPRAQYLKRLYAQLLHRARYPEKARVLGIEGLVKAQFKLSKDGRIFEPEIVEASHPLLAQAVLSVLQSVMSLEPWPEGLWAKEEIRLRVPFVYRLSAH